MKTIACSLLIGLMCFGWLSAAEINDTAYTSSLPASVKQALVAKVHYPEMAKELKLEGVVTASINIDKEGKISINQINGHPELVKYINNQLASLTLPATAINTKNVLVRFRFEIK